jgi:hypothetical protein
MQLYHVAIPEDLYYGRITAGYVQAEDKQAAIETLVSWLLKNHPEEQHLYNDLPWEATEENESSVLYVVQYHEDEEDPSFLIKAYFLGDE